MAFALPCCAIVLCYARIFYIVRETALKIHETQLKSNGSVRLKQDGTGQSQKKNKKINQLSKAALIDNALKQQRSSIESESSISSNKAELRRKKLLSKNQDDELKFIDTSVESDLPPTLSTLQRKRQCYSIEPKLSTPSVLLTKTPIEANYIKTNQLNEIHQISENEQINKERLRDFVVRDYTKVSVEGVRKEKRYLYLINLFYLFKMVNTSNNAVGAYHAILEQSSSSDVDISLDKENIPK